MDRLQHRAAVALLRPFQAFFELEASGGIVLLACAATALAWANGPWAETYFRLWETVITVGPERFALSKPLLLWVNDGLMAVFFFVVGLEIKCEVLTGELSSWTNAVLPVVAALGGMVVPALIYAGLNTGQPGIRGWGIPMATDIAFSLGALALLGSRVPPSLKVFLTAVAIVDDLGAVLVIALFYTAELSWTSLGAAALFLVALLAANRAGVHRTPVYALLGLGLWAAFLVSGVHATVAGVLLAMTIPARRRIEGNEFVERGRALLDAFAVDCELGRPALTENQRDAVSSLEVACVHVEAPLTRLERVLHPWVAFAIVPVFALANAGVTLGAGALSAAGSSITLGVALGLFLGKQLGVGIFSWAFIRARVAALPTGATWRQLYGVSCLCGIGFTMSLFIANLAFTDPAMLESAKIGILAASFISGIYGYAVLARSPAPGSRK